jgi:anti-sigma regulatory factor (Ser/Thr protein kinase)
VTGTAGRRTPHQAPQASGNRTGGTEPAPVLDRRFDAEGLFSLRSAVMAHADELADRTAAEDMVLVAHELATNAVRHGGGRGRLRMWATGGRLWCEVSDGGPGLPDPIRVGTEPPAPTMPGGRGLWIVRQMSDLTISTTTAGTTIRASVPKS